MVSGTLAPLYSFWVKVGLKRGSGPDRGQSPIEWGDFPSVRPSIRTYIRPPLQGPRASQASLRPSQSGLRASQAGLRASQPGLRASQPGLRALRPDWLGLRPAWLALGPPRGGTDGRTDGQTDEQTNGESPHSTGLCPLEGAAARLSLRLFNTK